MSRRRLRLATSRPARWDPTGICRRRRPADPRRYLRGVLGAAILGLAILPSLADAVNAALTPGLGNMLTGGELDGCRVLSVVDGDTVTLWCPRRVPERARLTGFDTPELFSPKCAWEAQAALRAKWHLRLMVWRADQVLVIRQGRDRYGRSLVSLTLDGRPVAREMIETGLARPYEGGRRAGWCGSGATATAPAARGTTAKWVRIEG